MRKTFDAGFKARVALEAVKRLTVQKYHKKIVQ